MSNTKKLDTYQLGGIHLCDDYQCDTKNCNNTSRFLVVKNKNYHNPIQMCDPCILTLEKTLGYTMKM